MITSRSRAVRGWLLTCALAAAACSDSHAPAQQAAHPADPSPRTDAGASGDQGGGGGTHEDSDFGNTHAAVDAAAPGGPEPIPPDVLQPGGDALLQCPTLMPCQSEPLSFMSELLASASDIAPDAHFVAIADSIVLAERGPNAEPVALRGQGVTFSATQLAHPKAVAIAGNSERSFALLCDDASCEVFKIDRQGEADPERITSLQAEPGALTGIVDGGCTTKPYEFCVYGDGLFCFDGDDWTTEIETGPRSRILSVAANGEHIENECAPLLVAGKHGMLQRYHAGWQVLDTGTEVDLTTVAAFAGRFTAAGNGVLIEGDPFGLLTCEIAGLVPQKLIRRDAGGNCPAPPPGAGILGIDDDANARGFNSTLYGITTSGQLLIGTGGCSGSETWKCDQQSVPNIDFSVVGCGIAANSWQLTRDALNGSKYCPID